jgi:hypothetical protein
MKKRFDLRIIFLLLIFLGSQQVLLAQEDEPKEETVEEEKPKKEKKKKIKAVLDEDPPAFYKGDAGGIFSFGVRSTYSTFSNNDWSNVGMGAGGSFRLQFSPRINSEWYFDYINSDIDRRASRTDYHIGWSVMFYPFPRNYYNYQPFRPFIAAGHCFDYTFVSENANPKVNNASRWSSAVQMGIGTHINFSPRVNMSITSQYMLHLGNDIHADVVGNSVTIHEHEGISLEGHLLFNLGIHYKIVDLW